MSGKPQIVVQENLGYHNRTPEEIKQKKNAYRDQSTIMIVPCMDYIPSKVVQNWMSIVSPMNQKFTRIFVMNMEVGAAYSETIEMILAHPELSKWKYIMTLEHDNMPQPDVLLRLLEDIELGYDAVGSLYYTKGVEGRPMCFDDKTEVLTEEGWKFFEDVSFQDKVATLNKDGFVEYHHPLDRQKYLYNGEMIHWKSQRVDLLVTPEHNVYCSKRSNKDKDTGYLPFDLYRASDVEKSSRIKFKRDADWGGEYQEYYHLTETRSFKMNDWIEFLGYYLADGHCVKPKMPHHKSYMVDIRKQEGVVYDTIADCLGRLGFNVRRNKGRIKFSDKEVYDYLKSFGKAPSKYVPRYIHTLSKEQISTFVDAIWLCDGHQKNGVYMAYETISPVLANDMQELLFKIGLVGVIGTRKYWNNAESKEVTKYVISASNSSFEPIMMNGAKRVQYEGLVYDLTVPNHTLYIRRNGRPLWSGNCYGLPLEFPTNFAPFQPAPDSVTQCNGLGMGATLFRMEMFKDTRLPRPLFETIQNKEASFTQDLKFFLEAGKLGYKFACSTRTLTGHYSVQEDMVW